MSGPRAALSALRPAHWLKNAPILAGLVFGGRIADGIAVRSVGLTFAAFCLVASAGYLVNDVVDRDQDRAHPLRGRRAVAAGALSKRAACLLAAVLALCGGALVLGAPPGAQACLATYAALTSAYTFLLRRVPMLASLAVAAGFVLRALAGAEAAAVPPSPWLLSLTGVLALALAVSKREAEARRRDGVAACALVRTTDALLLASALGYLSYGFSPDTVAIHATRWLPLTALPVLLALARYRSRLRASREGLGPAEIVARDPMLLVLGVVWAVLSVVVLRMGAR